MHGHIEEDISCHPDLRNCEQHSSVHLHINSTVAHRKHFVMLSNSNGRHRKVTIALSVFFLLALQSYTVDAM